MLPTLNSVIACPCGHEIQTKGMCPSISQTSRDGDEADIKPGHYEVTLATDIFPPIDRGTLATYLDRYLVEELHDYRCEGCKDNVLIKHRKRLLAHAPEIICVQLKRIHPVNMKKMLDHVPIDTKLNLNAYREASLKDQLNYELNGVVKHHGGRYSGHYIAFAKGPDGQWSRYDDSRKSTSNLATAVSSNGGFTPYMMFYQRTVVESLEEREKRK